MAVYRHETVCIIGVAHGPGQSGGSSVTGGATGHDLRADLPLARSGSPVSGLSFFFTTSVRDLLYFSERFRGRDHQSFALSLSWALRHVAASTSTLSPFCANR